MIILFIRFHKLLKHQHLLPAAFLFISVLYLGLINVVSCPVQKLGLNDYDINEFSLDFILYTN